MALTHELPHSPRVNSANNPVWMDGLRIILGLFLFVKGVMFLEYNSDVFHLFGSSQTILSAGKAHLMTSMVHIIGGLMIAVGVLTRLALLCQFPILLGALLINSQTGEGIANSELILSFVVTGLLLFFMIVGPGRYSVDNKILRPKPEFEADQNT